MKSKFKGCKFLHKRVSTKEPYKFEQIADTSDVYAVHYLGEDYYGEKEYLMLLTYYKSS